MTVKETKKNEVIEIEVEGYEEPFSFKKSPSAYRRLIENTSKNTLSSINKFLMQSTVEEEKLKRLLDEFSPEHDMTLAQILATALMEAIGGERVATVKKRYA